MGAVAVADGEPGLANYRSFWSGPPRDDRAPCERVGFKVALSVLYSFFDELALGKHFAGLAQAPRISARFCGRQSSIERNIERLPHKAKRS